MADAGEDFDLAAGDSHARRCRVVDVDDRIGLAVDDQRTRRDAGEIDHCAEVVVRQQQLARVMQLAQLFHVETAELITHALLAGWAHALTEPLDEQCAKALGIAAIDERLTESGNLPQPRVRRGTETAEHQRGDTRRLRGGQRSRHDAAPRAADQANRFLWTD